MKSQEQRRGARLRRIPNGASRRLGALSPSGALHRLGTPFNKMLGANELPLREVSGRAANFAARTGAERGFAASASQSSPPKAANRVKFVFSGGVYVGKNSSRGARVEDGEAVEARSAAYAVGRALPCPTASLGIAPAQFQVNFSRETGRGLRPRPVSRDFSEHISRREISSPRRVSSATRGRSRRRAPPPA